MHEVRSCLYFPVRLVSLWFFIYDSDLFFSISSCVGLIPNKTGFDCDSFPWNIQSNCGICVICVRITVGRWLSNHLLYSLDINLGWHVYLPEKMGVISSATGRINSLSCGIWGDARVSLISIPPAFLLGDSSIIAPEEILRSLAQGIFETTPLKVTMVIIKRYERSYEHISVPHTPRVKNTYIVGRIKANALFTMCWPVMLSIASLDIAVLFEMYHGILMRIVWRRVHGTVESLSGHSSIQDSIDHKRISSTLRLVSCNVFLTCPESHPRWSKWPKMDR